MESNLGTRAVTLVTTKAVLTTCSTKVFKSTVLKVMNLLTKVQSCKSFFFLQISQAEKDETLRTRLLEIVEEAYGLAII